MGKGMADKKRGWVKMKKLILFVCWMAAVFDVRAATEYRDFLDTQGRTIRGRVMGYDDPLEMVIIERDNKRSSKVSLSIFSGEDQQYIRAWGHNKSFLSTSLFKISAKRKEFRDKNSDLSGGDKSRKFENLGFEVILENRSTMELKDLEIEYCIYYEQEKTLKGKQVTDDCVRFCNLEVGGIPPKSKKELLTELVEIFHESAENSIQKGRLQGIRFRVYIKLPSGEKLTREYNQPASLDKIWRTSSAYISGNKR